MELLNKLTLNDLRSRYQNRLVGSTDVLTDSSSVRVRILIPEGLRTRVVGGARAYTVVVRDEGEQLLTACTCPYHLENAGDCKHIIATLAAWVREPQTFKPTPEWCRLLTMKSRDDLLAIIMDMCEVHPQLLEEYGLAELTKSGYPAESGMPPASNGTADRPGAP
jgi:uncharacterized Zn finger protein